MSRSKAQVLAFAALTGGLMVLAAVLSGCSASAVDLAVKSQTAADLAQRSAAEGFAKWDLAHQRALLAAARAAGRPAAPNLAAYRAERAKVTAAFAALAAASHGVSAALAVAGGADLGSVLGRLYAMVDRLREALAGLGFSWAPLDALLGGT